MKANKELLRLAEGLVTYGRKKGADQVQVSIGEGTDFSVDIRQGNIEKLLEAGSKGLSLKVILDNKVANASSSDFSEETLHRLVDNAIVRAKLTSSDPYAGLPENEKIEADVKALKIFDEKIVSLAPEKKIQAAKDTEAICLNEKRINKSHGASFSTYVGTSYLVNSNGFSSSYSQTSCTCGVYVQTGEGDNLFDEGKYDFSRQYETLMSPEAIAKEAIHRSTRLIGARKIDSQNVPVVLESNMTRSLLGFLYNCIDGNSVYLKQSFLTDKLNEKVGNDLITVIDDGLIPGAPGSRPFDSEGVPIRKTVVLDKGVLKNYLMDTYAARKLEMKSTGNASGPNNFHLVAGDRSPEEIIASVDKGLLLCGTLGHGLVPTTGDISRGAYGMWIEKGEIVYPVAEITINSNLGKLLNEVEMVGNDLEFNRSITGPTIKVKEISIGGK